MVLICAHHYSLGGALALFFLIFFFVIWRSQPRGSAQNYAKINGATTKSAKPHSFVSAQE